MPTEVVEHLRSLFDGCHEVLDLGCGQGDFLSSTSIGIDLDLDALRVSRGSVVQGDVSRPLPFRDAAFDGILAKDIIEHLASPLPLLSEAQRVSKPGSRLVLTTPRAIPRAVWDDYTHIRGFTKPALERLLVDTGWAEISIRRHGGVPLMGRFGLVRYVPTLLTIPVLGHRFGTNWLVIATKSDGPARTA